MAWDQGRSAIPNTSRKSEDLTNRSSYGRGQEYWYGAWQLLKSMATMGHGASGFVTAARKSKGLPPGHGGLASKTVRDMAAERIIYARAC